MSDADRLFVTVAILALMVFAIVWKRWDRRWQAAMVEHSAALTVAVECIQQGGRDDLLVTALGRMRQIERDLDGLA